MINIAFSDSLSGSLKMADYYAKQDNSEIQDLKANLHSIYMNLSMGSISFDEIGKERRSEFANLYGGGSETIYRAKWFDKTIKVVSSLEKLAKSGEEIRIWYSEYPDELCAFCWMLCLLDSWGIDNEKIFYVKLPNSILFNNGDYKTYFSSGAFDPEELTQLVFSQRKLTRAYKEAHIKQWHKVKEENTQLRTVIMGEIVSVHENFYDSVIKVESEKMTDTFKEAELLGKSLCKLCVSDSFVAWRIDEMIANGLFEIMEEAPKDRPYYCRVLRKVK